MEQVFQNGSKHDKREIMIKIENGCVQFFFYEQYLKRKQWVEEETQRKLEYVEQELTEDESENNEFYWFELSEWVKDKTERLDRADNWHKHMIHKNWFTKEMASFLNNAN